MKKILFIIGTIAVLYAALVVFSYLKNRVGDVRPAILPPKKTSQDTQSPTDSATIGETVEIPLNLSQEFAIGTFAKGLKAPRDLEFSPNGRLLASVPSDGKIVVLPDKNNDGIVDEVKNILIGLNNPHGLAFYNDQLFVAEETRVVRYNWDEANLKAAQDKVLFSLPAGGRHTSRTIDFDRTGRMFVSIGSSCDVCYEKHEWLAAVITSDAEGNNPRLWAKGLRNSVFITMNPVTQELWGADMGRDFLGDNQPPEEINIIRDGNTSTGLSARDYGWPNCYGNQKLDTEFTKNLRFNQDLCKSTEPPIYEFQAHSAPLGLTFIDSTQFPNDWQGDLLVAYHGSWNRSIPTGYKVVRMFVEGNKITGEEDFLTGFLSGSQTLGRPADVIFGSDGSLYVSDDKAGTIYKIIKKSN